MKTSLNNLLSEILEGKPHDSFLQYSTLATATAETFILALVQILYAAHPHTLFCVLHAVKWPSHIFVYMSQVEVQVLSDDEGAFCKYVGVKGKNIMEIITKQQIIAVLAIGLIAFGALTLCICFQAPCCPFNKWIKVMNKTMSIFKPTCANSEKIFAVWYFTGKWRSICMQATTVSKKSMHL